MTFIMVLQMTGVTLVYVLITVMLWKKMKDIEMTTAIRIGIGLLYGCLSILSTHFGINYGDMVLNVRDMGPMAAGLFFDPLSGIIAGLIGGFERYIAGTYFDVGSYTRIACSLSTCLAGFFAAFLKIYVLKDRLPGIAYSTFMGSLIEVFHMYVVFITHRSDMEMAYYVVRVCSIPMILFSGFGLGLSAYFIGHLSGENKRTKLFDKRSESEVPLSETFQVWLFIVTMTVFSLNFIFEFTLQTQAAVQKAERTMLTASEDIRHAYNKLTSEGIEIAGGINQHVGSYGMVFIVDSDGVLISDPDSDEPPGDILPLIEKAKKDEFFFQTVANEEMLCRIEILPNGAHLVMLMPKWEIYDDRNSEAYETMLSDILVFSVIYMLITMMVQYLVVNNLNLVNESLRKITGGNLNEKVNVYKSTEFASLSDDINLTVSALKGYIKAAEKRIEQELILARSIQEAALPKNFNYNHEGFEVFATMDPAREVGGDFYDFFFVDIDKLALVIADVSGKGIPAALFMMRSKTTMRGLAETGNQPVEVFSKTNEVLCEGNEACMFVTAWIGIIDLRTGIMKCVNAGHEYPSLQRRDGNYELHKERHNPALGFMEDMAFTEYELKLEPGDCLFVYTDGVPEAVNENNEQYGTDRMLEALNANKDKSMEGILPAVKADIDEFVGTADQFDDITMMGLRYNGMKAYTSKK